MMQIIGDGTCALLCPRPFHSGASETVVFAIRLVF